MYILVFETTGKYASVACINEKGELFEKTSGSVLSHLQSLMPMTELLMKESGIVMSDISCVAASTGPGSFTGIRIGVSSARAVAQAVSIPCISVPTLTAFSYNIENYQGLVCPILDARRNQVYGGAFYFSDGSAFSPVNSVPGGAPVPVNGNNASDIYEAEQGGGVTESKQNGGTGDICEAVPGGAYGIDEYLQLLASQIIEQGFSEVMFFGDGVKIYQDEIARWQHQSLNADIRQQYSSLNGDIRQRSASLNADIQHNPISPNAGMRQQHLSLNGDIRLGFAPGDKIWQKASSVAKLALKLYNEGKQVNYEELMPVYMRKAEAERKLEEGLLLLKR